MTTPIPPGTLNWDVPLNAYLETLDAGQHWRPSDQGFIGWSNDPGAHSTTTSLISGGARVVRINVRNAATISNLHIIVATGGSGLTAGQNWLALYDSSGALVGQSADLTTAFGSAGMVTAPITPYAAPVGPVYVYMLSNGTTPPVVASYANQVNNAVNFGGVTRTRIMTGSFTTPPATLGAATLNTVTYWVAVS